MLNAGKRLSFLVHTPFRKQKVLCNLLTNKTTDHMCESNILMLSHQECWNTHQNLKKKKGKMVLLLQEKNWKILFLSQHIHFILLYFKNFIKGHTQGCVDQVKCEVNQRLMLRFPSPRWPLLRILLWFTVNGSAALMLHCLSLDPLWYRSLSHNSFSISLLFYTYEFNLCFRSLRSVLLYSSVFISATHSFLISVSSTLSNIFLIYFL